MSASRRYVSTFAISWASCARLASSQKTAGAPVARARRTASFTQSRTAASFVWQPRKMSPSSTRCSRSVAPEASSTTRIVPAPAAMNVLSWEPYSSACCAMRPTLGTLPMVAGSSAPCRWQSSTIALYAVA